MMTRTDRWIDQQTENLLQADTELRALLRQMSRADAVGSQHLQTRNAARSHRTITLSSHEARTLLRACLPAPGPIFRGRARERHAAMISMMSLMQSHMVALASGHSDAVYHAERRCVATALDLIDTIRAWADEMQWRAATSKARMRWPRAGEETHNITTVMRQQAAPEQNETRPQGELQGQLIDDPAAQADTPRRATRRRRAA